MKLHELKPAKGAVKAKRRLGRGTATGQGKTAGRGQKGQDGVKILGEGNLERAITVQAAKFTASAQEKIEKAGGKAELV